MKVLRFTGATNGWNQLLPNCHPTPMGKIRQSSQPLMCHAAEKGSQREKGRTGFLLLQRKGGSREAFETLSYKFGCFANGSKFFRQNSTSSYFRYVCFANLFVLVEAALLTFVSFLFGMIWFEFEHSPSCANCFMIDMAHSSTCTNSSSCLNFERDNATSIIVTTRSILPFPESAACDDSAI